MFAYRRMLSGGVLSPLTKISVDLTILSASLFLSSKIGVTSVMRDLVPLRKKLLNEPDVDYLRHLLSKYQRFDFYKENEFTLYHDVMTASEFKEWKELHKFDVTKF
ncbi:unnamed protein product [Paramecium sonneborni]|uniref:Uncharacterized protein n=1 Tax=Paramecium sonneborni TaxID=65129 RepID=A0A8S1MUY0_9CILI|nr:unnamed protein product [Paramecium sonneborni]